MPEVREPADWVTAAKGGQGAVREVIDAVLSAQGVREQAVRRFLERLEAEQRTPPAVSAEAPGQ
jgi:hypothetical protein